MGSIHMEVARLLRLNAFKKMGNVKSPSKNLLTINIEELRYDWQSQQVELALQNEKLQKVSSDLIELREDRKWFFELSPLGYLLINSEGVITDVNRKASLIMGYESSELVQQPLAQFIDKEDKAFWNRIFLNMKVMAEGEEQGCEIRLTHNHGSIVNININCHKLGGVKKSAMLILSLEDITEFRQAELIALKTHNLLKTVIDAAPMRIFWKDKNLCYLGCNPAFAMDLGKSTPEELIGKDDFQLLSQDQAALNRADDQYVIESGQEKVSYDVAHKLSSGKTIWLRTSKIPLKYTSNEVFGVLGIYEDITEGKEAITKIHRLSLLYAALSQCNQAVMRCDNKEDLFSQICHDVVVFGGMKMAWIGLIDIPNKKVHPAASFGDNHKYLTGIEISLISSNKLSQGPVGEAIRTNQPVWCQNYVNDLMTLPWRARGEVSHWESMAALPIKCNGLIVGTFNLYSGVKNAFDEDIRKLLMEMSNDISFALDNFSREDERRNADSNLRIAAISFESKEGKVVTDANKIILRVNQAFTQMSGYSVEEAINQPLQSICFSHHHEAFYEEMWVSIKTHGGWEGEVWNCRKQGEVYPQHLIVTAVKDMQEQVTNYVASLTDITKSKAAADEIEHLAFYDPLTHLPNRRLLLDRLQHALATSARMGWRGALLYLDLDHFKIINDTRGHNVGDMLLRQVSVRLICSVREGDTVARLGGDEFVVMLENLSENEIEAAKQTEAVATKIYYALTQQFQLEDYRHRCTASIGVVMFLGHEHSQEELLKHADIAMYQSKKAGRNLVRFFDPKMQENINALASLESDLHLALELEQFQLHYQIQVDHLGHSLGAEALIRWFHPVRGLVSPIRFIPIAEETGLILPIGQWVLDTACAQLKAWESDTLTRHLTLSVNVSARQFRQENFVEQVQTALRLFNIKPEHLKLELTESVLLESIESTVVSMIALESIGVQFSLDDFGTGYSSLQYLKLLPLNQLKIDQSFVRDITVDPSDRTIVRTIIAMAKTMHFGLIAEGVETEGQRQILLDAGCKKYQGYLFGKPLPIEAFDAQIKHRKK